MTRKRALVLIIIIALALTTAYGEQPKTGPGLIKSPVPGFFDNAFFAGLNYIYSKLTIFQNVAFRIARLAFMADAFVLLILVLFGLADLYKEAVGRLITLALALGLMSAWSNIYMTVSQITLEIANIPVKDAIGNAEYELRKDILLLYENYGTAKKEEAKIKEETRYSDPYYQAETTGVLPAETESERIKKQIEGMMGGMSNLQIWAKGTQKVPGTDIRIDYGDYLRPEAILLFTTGLLAPAWADVQSVGIDIGRALTYWSMIILSFVLGSLITIQYIIAMIEWAMVGAIGILMIPLGLFKGTKFMTERLIATAIGHIVKIIVMYFIVGIVTGVIFKLAKDQYYGTMDQVMRIIFSYFMFYMMTSQVPGLAQGFMGGSPSLSMASAAQTGAAISTSSQSAVQTAMKTASSSYHAAHSGSGAIGAALGAAAGTEGGFKDKAGAFGHSLAASAVNTIRSGSTDAKRGALASSVFARGASVDGGGGGGGGGGIQDQGDADFQKKINPYSHRIDQMQNPTASGYFMERYRQGKESMTRAPKTSAEEAKGSGHTPYSTVT